MSRTARNSKVLRSGAIGFLAGLATLGVVAHGSPARGLIDDTTSSVRVLAGESTQTRTANAQRRDARSAAQSRSQEQWLVPQAPSQQPAQPQYQQPQQQQQQVQPAPAQQPQSQAS